MDHPLIGGPWSSVHESRAFLYKESAAPSSVTLAGRMGLMGDLALERWKVKDSLGKNDVVTGNHWKLQYIS